ncbi:YbaB/EbfC family nucleoid-associated protein [Nocardia grenadensis]|uniref:YbaB/EbfC family nucleoid-associated protein n=1 Tax=Nocardia grenadensis TaxID=931537 RepID=UPI003D710674
MSDGDPARPATGVLRDSVAELLSTLEQQRQAMTEVRQRLAATTVSVWSADNLVRIDANTAGVPVEVHLTPEAFKRSTPEKLGRSILETAQRAAREAADLSREAWAPVREMAGEIPDLPDIAPGMPSIKSLTADLFPDPVTEAEPPTPMDREEEDEFYRSRGYLEGGR